MVIGGRAFGWGGGVYDKVIGVEGWGWGVLQNRHSMVEPTPRNIYITPSGQAVEFLSNAKNTPPSTEGNTATPYPEK